jgi:uncharacterized membrane protein
MSADHLEVLRAVAVVVAFVGVVVGLLGVVFVGLKYQYLRYTKKTYAMAFLTGPFAWILVDKDSAKYLDFKSRMKVFSPLFVVSAIALVSLTM